MNDNTPITGEYDNGPVQIKWSVFGTGYTKCQVTVLFNTDQVAQNTLHPDQVNWDTGKHVTSDGWVEANLQMTVPTPDQEGALELALLAWEQGGHGEQDVENVQLVTWTQTGQA